MSNSLGNTACDVKFSRKYRSDMPNSENATRGMPDFLGFQIPQDIRFGDAKCPEGIANSLVNMARGYQISEDAKFPMTPVPFEVAIELTSICI